MSGRGSTKVTLMGGPHHGRTITVDRTAGHLPTFLGVDGANYLPQGRTDSEDPGYEWTPVTDRAREIPTHDG